jgi:hypothetical protein
MIALFCNDVALFCNDVALYPAMVSRTESLEASLLKRVSTMLMLFLMQYWKGLGTWVVVHIDWIFKDYS